MNLLDREEKATNSLISQMAEERSKLMSEAQNSMEREEQQANALIQRIMKEQDIMVPSILDKIERDEKELMEFRHDEGISVDELIERDLMENAAMARFLNAHMSEQKSLVSHTLKNIEAEENIIANQVREA